MSPRENSVKQLAEFYNVVTGVALALAITKVIDTTANVLPIKWGFGLNFLSFVVTIIPFHHGAVRHLFATYVESGEKKRIIRGALALDFLLLFSQACLFVALALLIQKTQLFTSVLIGLLILDCIWGFLTNLTLSNAQDQGSERIWAFINLFGAAFFVLLSSFGPALVAKHDAVSLCRLLRSNSIGLLFLLGLLLPLTQVIFSQPRRRSHETSW